jgi:four helix bundle protein
VPGIKSFRDLRVWQRGVELASDVYRLARALPSDERPVLGDQLRRAANSVPANIAEGHTRLHRKEFQHFLSVAHGSLSELETHVTVAERVGYLSREDVAPLLAQADELSRMMTVLRLRLDKARHAPRLPSDSSLSTPRPSPLGPDRRGRDASPRADQQIARRNSSQSRTP